MAIAPKSITTGTNNGSPKTVTCVTSESPSATAVGDLVVVIYGNNYYTLAAMGTPSATGTPTMNAIVTADAGSSSGHIKSYWYVANTAGAQTIQATETGSGDEEKYITAYVLSGADTTTPIDGSASGFSATATTSHVAPAVSPATSDAFLIAEATSGGGSATASYTTPGALTEDGEIHVGGLSGVYASDQLAASGSTGTFTFTPATSIPYVAVTIAIKTAAGGGTTPVTATRATTWDVRTAVTATRAASWDTRTAVTASRATTYDVRSTVTASRSTTWDTRAVVAATRATTWDTRAAVTGQRSTTWDVESTLVSVTASRATTWRTLAAPTSTRVATWDTRAIVTDTRSTTWDVLTPVAASRAASWDVLASTGASRVATWRTLASASSSRSTTWAVDSEIVLVTPIERTHAVGADNRTHAVPTESRTTVVSAESRTTEVS